MGINRKWADFLKRRQHVCVCWENYFWPASSKETISIPTGWNKSEFRMAVKKRPSKARSEKKAIEVRTLMDEVFVYRVKKRPLKIEKKWKKMRKKSERKGFKTYVRFESFCAGRELSSSHSTVGRRFSEAFAVDATLLLLLSARSPYVWTRKVCRPRTADSHTTCLEAIY